MAPRFKPALIKLARQGLEISWTRWLQLAIGALVTWIWFRPGAAPSPIDAGSPGRLPTAAAIAPVGVTSAPGAVKIRAAKSDADAKSDPPQATMDAQVPTTPTSPPPSIETTDLLVTANDTLDHLFRKQNLSLSDLATLRAMPGIKGHVDNLRLGETLHITHRGAELDGFERRLNENETLKVVRENGALHANVIRDPLEARTITISGVIDRSLFEAVTAAGAHDQTAVNLGDIFGWDIDFVLDIQPGDSFTVTYQELYLKGVFVKDGPVLAARFVNRGRPYLAVRYVDPDGAAHYYTPDGKSMRKAFLRAPVEFTRISSKFNSTRLHPILNLIRAHKGIDYAAPVGTPVRAAGDGRVTFAGPKGGYGNLVEIEHTRSIVTVYGHLSRFARGTHMGEHVTQGTVIGYVGMTGLATGPHLHYEYRVNGVFKNPQTLSLPDATPIEARWRDDFLSKTAPLLATVEPAVGAALVAR